MSTRLKKIVWLAFCCIGILATATSLKAQNPFITEWDLSKSGRGNPNTAFSFKVEVAGPVTYTWQELSPGSNTGNGTINASGTVTISSLTANAKIRLSIHPTNLQRFYMEGVTGQGKLSFVAQWGDVVWTSMQKAFINCFNMDVTAADAPNLGGVTDLSDMFNSCSNLKGNAVFNSWIVSSVNNMSNLFLNAKAFNQPIGSWVVNNVTNMSGMFSSAETFNQPIGAWVVDNVKNMSNMFLSAITFNQPIGSWHVDNVTDMSYMFYQAQAFNQPIGSWVVNNVTNMSNMFYGAEVFNQPIGSWDVDNVTRMTGMFGLAKAFNHPLNNWKVGNVTEMAFMFGYAYAFNQPLDKWDVSKVTSMGLMFNQATAFNQNLGKWNLSSVTNLKEMLGYSGMNCENYDRTLHGWFTGGTAPNTLTLGADGLKYSASYGVNARNELTKPVASGGKGWTINEDSYLAGCNTTPLPVVFDNIEAFLKNSILSVNWKTVSENNNGHFEIQVSEDGSDFKTIGTVQSQSGNGNRSTENKYSFSINMQQAMGLAGVGLLGILGICLVPAGRKKYYTLAGLIAILTILAISSCHKTDVQTDAAASKKLFVRLQQVDKDGKTSVSKTVRVVSE